MNLNLSNKEWNKILKEKVNKTNKIKIDGIWFNSYECCKDKIISENENQFFEARCDDVKTKFTYVIKNGICEVFLEVYSELHELFGALPNYDLVCKFKI